MLLGELLASFTYPGNAGLWAGPVLIYMVLTTFVGLFSLRLGNYYSLERGQSSA